MNFLIESHLTSRYSCDIFIDDGFNIRTDLVFTRVGTICFKFYRAPYHRIEIYGNINI
jgi:hypothetical protein